MAIDLKLIDQLLVDYKKPEDIIGENGLLKQLTKALLERALNAELTEHVGYEKHDPAGHNSGNSRNGKSTKSLKGDFGEIELETPRDRNGSFEPKIVSKGQTRFTGFDDKIISMYSRGMTTREIEGHLKEMYGIDVSPTLISNVTEAVMEEVKAWQSRPLEEVYPILYMDALRVKVRDGGHVQNKAIHVAMGVNMEGHKEILGLWTAQNEGAKFWLQVLTDIRNRGVKDIFIACVDGLKGFPEAIETTFPQTEVQLCIVHLVRASLGYVSWKQRKAVASDLRLVYQSATAYDADLQMDTFAKKWDGEPVVAPELGTGDTVLRLPGGDPQGDLHDQCDRVAEHVAAENHQDAGVISKRRSGFQVVVPGATECVQKMDHADTQLERGVEPLQHLVAGADACLESSLRSTLEPPKKGDYELGALPPNPRDLAHYCQDSLVSAARAALGRAESRPLSRRSGRVPAEPYPPLRCNQCSRKPSTTRKPFTQNS